MKAKSPAKKKKMKSVMKSPATSKMKSPMKTPATTKMKSKKKAAERASAFKSVIPERKAPVYGKESLNLEFIMVVKC